jgi:Ubiquitin-2 like Rad60 SUMO-like
VGVYRERLKIPSNRSITIELDGDPLMESATVKTLDVDDGDVLDVQIDDA